MRLRYFHREIKAATSSYDSGAQPWRVGNAWIGSYENPIFPTIRPIDMGEGCVALRSLCAVSSRASGGCWEG